MIAEALTSLAGGFRKHAADSGYGWRDIFGGRQTAAGIEIDEARAQTFSAVWRATRVLSEGVASLPCNLREHVNDQETKTAYDHPAWSLIHDQPNPEQDSFSFFDMQVPLEVNGGNCYAEIQRNPNGSPAALWPIHPSRIPYCNIGRGPYRVSRGTSVGEDGEIVYLVRNNDGTTSPIPARDMLHVPGVMSSDGITGKGIVTWAAETLGIIGATEQHVGAFYRNGATPDIVIKVPSSVPKEERENMRTSWATRQGGVGNAHKALILVGESDAKAIGIEPEKAQLIDGRKFGIAEVSRFWGVPLHFLSSMEAATFNNVELLGQVFLTYTLRAWLIRWEMAMKRQLLTPEERKRFSFKFNINALMRGDSATRSQFYVRMFDLGGLNIDEIRELEDMNPLPNGMGKRYFILANNRVPLDRIDDVNTLTNRAAATGDDGDPEDDAASEANQEAARALLRTTMGGLIGYEARAAVRASADSKRFETSVETFYADKFPAVFTKAVRPVVAAMNAVGLEECVESLLFAHVDQSRSQLLKCLEAPFSEFVATVQRTVDSWANRYQE